MKNFSFNCLLKSSTNKNLWLNIKSAEPVFSNEKTVDYVIKYIILFESVNGEKIKINDFIYNSLLSEMENEEKKYIARLIKAKEIINEKKKYKDSLVLEPIYI